MDKQIIIRDLLISYSQQGEGGRAVLFLHGWRSNKEVWRNSAQLISQSANQPVSCYALDLPGFGGSQMFNDPHPPSGHLPPGGEGGNSVADYSDVVAEFIGKLELKNVIVVGHSFGGRVGIKLSSQHPELVSKLVLVDSAGFAINSPKKKIMAMAAKIVRPIFKPKIMHGLRKKIYRTIGAEDYVATPELTQTFINVVKEDLSGDIAAIHIPTLIVWGRGDRETPLRFGEKMYAGIKNSSLVILEHAGHFSFLDQPEKFCEILNGFVAQARGLPNNGQI